MSQGQSVFLVGSVPRFQQIGSAMLYGSKNIIIVM